MPIHYEKNDEHVVLITIDRPESKNSLDIYHFRDLAAAWRRFGEDDDAWTAIVTALGSTEPPEKAADVEESPTASTSEFIDAEFEIVEN